MRAASRRLLHEATDKSPFGRREEALFASNAAHKYVQSIANRCVEAIGDDFEDEDTWSDLAREGMSLGLLAVLLVLEPCTVKAPKLTRWRKCAKKGLEALRKDPDDELEFHEKYYANLDRVLAALLARFA